MALNYLLMGAEAAGLIGELYAGNAASRMGRRAQKVEEAQIDLRMKQDRIASNERALMDIEQLTETLATQRAFMAVRGGSPGAGSNLAVTEKSVAKFNKDQIARNLSLEFSQQQLSSQKAIGRMALAGQEAERGAKLFKNAFNMLPLSEGFGTLAAPKSKTTTKKLPGYAPMKPVNFKDTSFLAKGGKRG